MAHVRAFEIFFRSSIPESSPTSQVLCTGLRFLSAIFLVKLFKTQIT